VNDVTGSQDQIELHGRTEAQNATKTTGVRRYVDVAESPDRGASVDAITCTDADETYSLLESDDRAEGENSAESFNRARGNKIVRDVYLADPAMQKEVMCSQSMVQDHDYRSVIGIAMDCDGQLSMD
jgi:hypothetical protein